MLVVVFGFGVSVVVVFEETFSVVGVVVVELFISVGVVGVLSSMSSSDLSLGVVGVFDSVFVSLGVVGEVGISSSSSCSCRSAMAFLRLVM